MVQHWKSERLLSPAFKPMVVHRGSIEFGPHEDPQKYDPGLLPPLTSGMLRTSTAFILSADLTKMTCVVTDEEI